MIVPNLVPQLAQLAATTGVPDDELLRRFADHGDAAAFELLVWRYAGLVYGTARRALGRAADADDAFQAAFLALARKAGTVRRAGALGGWLHRVALRAALRLRADRARRAEREGALLQDAPGRESFLPDDTASVIDEELARLPEKLRVAFVLCELDGRTDAEAAAHLGCPVGTVQSRLSRAREKLRTRLARRGLAPLALPLAPFVVPPALVNAAARDAVPFATGAAVEGAPAALARAVLRPNALKPALGALALALVAVGAVFAAQQTDPPPEVPVRVELAPPPRAVAPVPRVNIDLAALKVREVDRVLFSPNGKWVAVSGQVLVPHPPGEEVGGERRAFVTMVFDATAGKLARTFTEADGARQALAFSPDGTRFVANQMATKWGVSVWDTGTWKKHYEVGHASAHWAAFSADGALLLTHSPEMVGGPFGGVGPSPGVTNVWDAATGKRVCRPDTGDRSCLNVWFAPDGNALLATVGGPYGPAGFGKEPPKPKPPALCTFDLATGKKTTEVPFPPAEEANAAMVLPGGAVLPVGGSLRTRASLWDAATGKKLFEYGPAADRDRPQRVLPSPDGKWIAGRTEVNEQCWLWDAATGKKVAEFALPKEYLTDYLWFSPDGAHWGTTGFKDTDTGRQYLTVFHSLATGKESARLPDVRTLAFAGRAVVVLKERNGYGQALDVLPAADLFTPPAK